MHKAEIRHQWESAATGWARWESAVSAWMKPATEAMLDLAGVSTGARVLDLACGAGSQTLRAALRVGPDGHVVASDISETMLRHVAENARAQGLTNVSTLHGAAEDLDVPPGSFDSAICRLGLMLFADPGGALRAVSRALRPNGRVAFVVMGSPAANQFMADPMAILLKHAGKTPPAPGQPGIFALPNPASLQRLLSDSGFDGIDVRTMATTLHLASAADALAMMQEAFGAYRAIVATCPESVRAAAWAEVGDALRRLEARTGFAAPAEVLVAAGTKPA